MFNSILVVCVGNICRSPTGAALLRTLLPTKKISSAGLSALVGKAADPQAAKIALSNGLDLNGHSAVQLTKDLCRDYSLILVMEKGHIDAVSNLSPESRGKVMLFGHWLQNKEIADPYKKSDEAFDFVFHSLSKSAQEWAQVLDK